LATQQEKLKAQQSKAQQLEHDARVKAAEAAQARRDAEALIAPAQQRINALSEENALLKRRLTGSIEALERKKRQLRELKKNDADLLLAEIERLRGMIREDRQQMQRLEERLRTAKSAVS
jgi:chromosome segregation ATPase